MSQAHRLLDHLTESGLGICFGANQRRPDGSLLFAAQATLIQARHEPCGDKIKTIEERITGRGDNNYGALLRAYNQALEKGWLPPL